MGVRLLRHSRAALLLLAVGCHLPGGEAERPAPGSTSATSEGYAPGTLVALSPATVARAAPPSDPPLPPPQQLPPIVVSPPPVAGAIELNGQPMPFDALSKMVDGNGCSHCGSGGGFGCSACGDPPCRAGRCEPFPAKTAVGRVIG